MHVVSGGVRLLSRVRQLLRHCPVNMAGQQLQQHP